MHQEISRHIYIYCLTFQILCMFWLAGIRGEVQVIVKVDFFLDFNKFRQTSCGVKFFYSKYLYSINSVNSS